MQYEGQTHIPSGCAISGIFSRSGEKFSGEDVIRSIEPMHDRSNGLGGGFAAYGIYPKQKDLYAFHVFYDSVRAKEECEHIISSSFDLNVAEKIPTRRIPEITDEPAIWRYFGLPYREQLEDTGLDEREFVSRFVMKINTEVRGAYVFSSGKNMGVFKAVGFPEDVGRFYRLEDYEGYCWTAHGRYPTNTPGWWGGAHPFALLDYSVVHNGEISSYDANRRFIEMFGYSCTLLTDTEVITYIIDYLNRRQGLSLKEVADVVAAPFWSEIDAMPEKKRRYYTYLRNVYSSLLITGPFSILVGYTGGMMALNDRCKLRSMVVGEHGDTVYVASEECAIRTIQPDLDRLWSPRGGEPVIVTLNKGGNTVMAINYNIPEYDVVRDPQRCIACRVCERQCSNEVHWYDAETGKMRSDETKCVNCHRCVALCPTHALKIVKNPDTFRLNGQWDNAAIGEVFRQAETGGMLLSSMGNPKNYPIYWDKMLINASQVTNPSIDPLREPMETRTFLGKKPSCFERGADGAIRADNLPPQLELSVPIMFSAMSYGSISYNAHESLARAATELGTYYNTGEGGLHEDFYKYGPHTIVQVASGRFGVHQKYLEAGAAIEIKIGQGAKPGIGGHLPGAKISGDVSRTRMIPEGSDAISPAPHHDIYSIEDLRQLVYSLKEATNYSKPVIVKIAAVHNVAAIASGIARSGADIIAIDGFRGGTGAAPTRIRDNVGIPIELALASVDERLRQEKIRNNVSLVVGGSIRNSADVVKAVALGADAVYIGTAALLALGCHLCRTCQNGKCNWGIATQRPDLVKRLNPDIGYKRLVNLVSAWQHEIMEMMGGMGINSIEALRGNRLMLRGVGLNEKELEILGIKHAGE